MTPRQEEHPASTQPTRNGAEGTANRQPPEAEAPEPPAHVPDPAELEAKWLRALADLDNLRKRYSRELTTAREAERRQVASAFLPVLDNIDLALRHARDERADGNQGPIVEGLRAIRDQALAVFAQLGYPRQDEAGVPFDPARHEVVSVVYPEDGTMPGLVVEVLRPGYGDPGRQLRPAAVTVARDPER